MTSEHKVSRNKPSLSCTNCRKRKTKCDRKQPCSACVKKINLSYTCAYDTPPKQFAINSDTPPTEYPARKRHKPETIDDAENPVQQELARLRKRIIELETSLQHAHTPKTPPENKNYPRNKPILSPTSSTCPNPIVNDEEIINFYEGYTPIQVKRNIRRVNYGPLSWIALMRKDPALNLAWKVLCSKDSYCIITNRWPRLTSENNALINISHNPEDEKNSNYMDKIFQKRVLEFEGYDEFVPYRSLYGRKESDTTNTEQPTTSDKSTSKPSSTTTTNPGPRLNFTQISLAKSIFDGRINPELHLIEKIKQIVPKRKVFWTLMDRFFTDIYPYFPFVDEESFKKELLRIFGTRTYTDLPFESIRIEKKLDLANIAICFILLRLTYLSFFNNRNCVNEFIMNSEEETVAKYIMQNPINLSTIEVANSCIQCFQFTRKSNITVFQAMLYMRIYRNCAPEESDGIDGGDSQVATALLVQMAYSLGLNREPDKFDVCNDEKVNHLGRKMWSFLMRSDLTQCYTLGNPTSIDPRNYDVRPPFVNDNNSNIEDREMEIAIVETFVYLNSELDLMRKMLDHVLDINNGAKINDLTRDVHDFEVILHDFFNVLGNVNAGKVKTDRESVIQYYHVIKLKIFLSMKTALVSLYFHIYLHYEKRFDSELSFFYLSKMYLIIRDDLIPAIGHTLIGKYSSKALVLNPNMQLALHKINQINLSCLIRVSYLVHMFEQKPNHEELMANDIVYLEHFNKLKSLMTNVRRTGDFVRVIMERIGSRYYYSWRIAKAHVGLFKMLSQPENYDKQLSGIRKLKSFQFTPKQLDELDNLIRILGKCAEKLVFYEDSVGMLPDFEMPFKPSEGDGNEKDQNQNDSKTTTTTTTTTTSDSTGISITPENNASAIMTPYSSLASPRLHLDNISNDYVDQMWFLMMAMKYDTLEPMGNNPDCQNCNSDDPNACPVSYNTRDNGVLGGTGGQLLTQQKQMTAQEQLAQQEITRQMQFGNENGYNNGFFLNSGFDFMDDGYFYG